MLAACSPAPKVVPIEQIAFPVVLITGSSPRDKTAHRAEVELTRDDLSHMRVERYMGPRDSEIADPPIVIDRNARIFDMTEIKGAHGSLWMMANPTGQMPITFKLTLRKAQGINAARALIAVCEYLGRDLDSERHAQRVTRLDEAQTMPEMMAIIDEMPPREPPE